jgi:RimJ/RimL family protein N-acetyltransferase
MVEIVLPRRTERLVLRSLRETDSADLLAYRGRPDVCRYLMNEPHDRAGIEAFIAERAPRTSFVEDRDAVLLGVELAGRVIGDVSLTTAKVVDRQGEIGWVFHPDHQGHGYATEAARALLDLAFDEVGLHRVCAQLDPSNTASEQLCVRLGMRQEAHLREESWFNGEWGDLLVYAVLDREWRDQRDAATATATAT